jgi:hypothetical protein
MPLVRSPHSVHSSGLNLMASLSYQPRVLLLDSCVTKRCWRIKTKKIKAVAITCPHKQYEYRTHADVLKIVWQQDINGRNVLQRARKQGRPTLLELVSSRGIHSSKRRYTPSVKLNDFTAWRHTWRKNWANCAVLTGNSAGLRTVISNHLSHREMSSSFRETHKHSGQFLVQFFTQLNCTV